MGSSDKTKFPNSSQMIRIGQEIEFFTLLSCFEKLQYAKHEDSLPLYALHNLKSHRIPRPKTHNSHCTTQVRNSIILIICLTVLHKLIQEIGRI